MISFILYLRVNYFTTLYVKHILIANWSAVFQKAKEVRIVNDHVGA